jgi:hypothetical protein
MTYNIIYSKKTDDLFGHDLYQTFDEDGTEKWIKGTLVCNEDYRLLCSEDDAKVVGQWDENNKVITVLPKD